MKKGGAAVIARPPVSPVNDGSDPFAMSKQGRPTRPKGKKLNKSDIGLPSDFRLVVAVLCLPITVANGVCCALSLSKCNVHPSIWRVLLCVWLQMFPLCRHLAHVGFDPQTGAFDVSAIESVADFEGIVYTVSE